MSIEEKIRHLESYIADSPAFKDVPFIIVAGKPITPTEALAFLRTGRYTSEVIAELSKAGLDPPSEPWLQAEDFYRRLVAVSPDFPKLYSISEYVPAMSPKEALEHIRARDAVGERLVRKYSEMLNFMALQAKR